MLIFLLYKIGCLQDLGIVFPNVMSWKWVALSYSSSTTSKPVTVGFKNYNPTHMEGIMLRLIGSIKSEISTLDRKDNVFHAFQLKMSKEIS